MLRPESIYPESMYPHYWKPTIEISIRKDMSLTKGDKVVWVVWLEKPSDEYFKEFMSRDTFTDAYKMVEDLVKFLRLFITEYPSVIERYRFDIKINRVAGIIRDDEIEMIKKTINGILSSFKF